MSSSVDLDDAAQLDRRSLLAVAAAGVAGAVVADDAAAAKPAPVRTVTGTYADPTLTLFKRGEKSPVDGFNRALVNAAAKLALKPGQTAEVRILELSAHAVYAKDPGAYDEYRVTLSY